MTKWEYRTVYFDMHSGFGSQPKLDHTLVDKKLNELGKEGWELVTAFGKDETEGWTKVVYCILKRPMD